MADWKVTVRTGPQVGRESFDSLDEALAFARKAAGETMSGEGLGTVKAFRDYGPAERVHTRVEISGKGFLRGPEAGIDVMGDGRPVPYVGSMRKRQLEAGTLDEAIEAIRAELS